MKRITLDLEIINNDKNKKKSLIITYYTNKNSQIFYLYFIVYDKPKRCQTLIIEKNLMIK